MLVALLVVATASANESFPRYVYDYLGLEVAPACTLCHRSNDGEKGTVVRPFGVWMLDHGLRGDSTEQELTLLLDENEQKGVDSDADGIGDIEELRDGTDPNAAGNTRSPPIYGCLSTTPGTMPAAFLALVALGLVRRRR